MRQGKAPHHMTVPDGTTRISSKDDVTAQGGAFGGEDRSRERVPNDVVQPAAESARGVLAQLSLNTLTPR